MEEAAILDIFGVVIFACLLGLGIWLIVKQKLRLWMRMTIFLIGLVGLIADGFIVIKNFLIK